MSTDLGFRICFNYTRRDTKHQGAGIGTMVIEKLLSDAKACHRTVELGVFKSNHSAIKLYVRLGFKQISETPTHILMKFVV